LISTLNKYYYRRKISVVKSAVLSYLVFWFFNCTLNSLLPDSGLNLTSQSFPEQTTYSVLILDSHNILPIQDETSKIKINLRLKSITEFSLSDYSENEFNADKSAELLSSEIKLIHVCIINQSITPRSPPAFVI
jgi:hypothetical protein